MTVMVAITSAGYDDLRLLPGDHDVLYFVAAILIAAAGTWWIGLYDRDD